MAVIRSDRKTLRNFIVFEKIGRNVSGLRLKYGNVGYVDEREDQPEGTLSKTKTVIYIIDANFMPREITRARMTAALIIKPSAHWAVSKWGRKSIVKDLQLHYVA